MFLYHVAPADRLAAIAREGLVPSADWAMGPARGDEDAEELEERSALARVFLVGSEAGVRKYLGLFGEHGTLVLRVARSALGEVERDEAAPGEFFVTGPIPVGALEVRASPDRWIRADEAPQACRAAPGP